MGITVNLGHYGLVDLGFDLPKFDIDDADHRRLFAGEYDQPIPGLTAAEEQSVREATSENMLALGSAIPAMAVAGWTGIGAGATKDGWDLNRAVDYIHKAEDKFTYSPKGELAQQTLADAGKGIEKIGNSMLPAREAYHNFMDPLVGPEIAGGIYAGGQAALALAPMAPLRAITRGSERLGSMAGKYQAGRVAAEMDKMRPDAPRSRLLTDQREPGRSIPETNAMSTDRQFAETTLKHDPTAPTKAAIATNTLAEQLPRQRGGPVLSPTKPKFTQQKLKVPAVSEKWRFNALENREGGTVDLLINPDEAALARFAGRDNPNVRFMIEDDTGALYVWEAETAIHDQVIEAIPNLHRENLNIWSDYPVKANELFDEFRNWEEYFPERFEGPRGMEADRITGAMKDAMRPAVWEYARANEAQKSVTPKEPKEWGAASHEAIAAREDAGRITARTVDPGADFELKSQQYLVDEMRTELDARRVAGEATKTVEKQLAVEQRRLEKLKAKQDKQPLSRVDPKQRGGPKPPDKPKMDFGFRESAIRKDMKGLYLPENVAKMYHDNKFTVVRYDGSSLRNANVTEWVVFDANGKMYNHPEFDTLRDAREWANARQTGIEPSAPVPARTGQTTLNEMVGPEDVGRIGYGKDFVYDKPTADQKSVIALGNLQRGAPEAAMVKVQATTGGGVLNPVVEHVGDITHRMTEATALSFDMGYEFVAPKVTRGLHALTSGYGFEREMLENIAANARFAKENPQYGPVRTAEELDAALKVYADEHRKLPVYNEMQRAARDAAVAIGEKNWAAAIKELRTLDEVLKKGPEAWSWAASKFDKAFDKQRGSLGENKGDPKIKKQGANALLQGGE